jgi:uncharacterized protein
MPECLNKEVVMTKLKHEIRDAIYGMITFDNLDKKLIDSAPIQRLRHIHQLAMCYQVYPGATHRRFEHSIGVMDVATRMFDSVFNKDIREEVKERISEELQPEKKQYWRRVTRIAALLHDVGHPPFSHAGEGLFPDGWNHERMTMEIICKSELAVILKNERPAVDIEDIVDVAVEIKKRKDEKILSPWKTLLNEIITGNTFGADRIDYLLRDSWHAGVAYGRFDPIRLIEGLHVIIDPATDEISLGLEYGSIHAAEALLLARYFMYTQVYFHDVRRAYDVHLNEFLKYWLPNSKFPTNWIEFEKYTDNKVLDALADISVDSPPEAQKLALQLHKRKHFRTIYELITVHKVRCPTIFEDLFKAIKEKFGEENVRIQAYGPKDEKNNFVVITENNDLTRSIEISSVIKNIPPLEIGLIFVDNSIKEDAQKIIGEKLRSEVSI